MSAPFVDFRPEERRVHGGVMLLAVGLILWFFYEVRDVVMPFLLAAVLAYLLNPLVSFLEIRGVRREKAVVILFVGFTVLMTGLAYWALIAVGQDIPDLRANWPDYMHRAEAAMRRAQEVLEFEWPELKRTKILEKTITDAMAWIHFNWWKSQGFVTSVFEFAVNLLLIPFVAFFFLRGGPRAAQITLDACPGVWVERFLSLLSKINGVFGKYARGMIFEAFFVGVFSVAGLWFIGLDYAALIGIAAGLGNMIPYLGPVVGGAVGMIVAIFQFSNLEGPARVLVVFLAVHYIDSWILQPLIMKRSVNLNPVTVIFALMAGLALGGLWGLVFAVPVASLVKEAGVVIHEWYRSERGMISSSRDIAQAAAKPWVF